MCLISACPGRFHLDRLHANCLSVSRRVWLLPCFTASGLKSVRRQNSGGDGVQQSEPTCTCADPFSQIEASRSVNSSMKQVFLCPSSLVMLLLTCGRFVRTRQCPRLFRLSLQAAWASSSWLWADRQHAESGTEAVHCADQLQA